MKHYLIIGASRGIGRALAVRLSQGGAGVTGTYRTTPAADSERLMYHSFNVLDENPDLHFAPETVDGLVYCPGAIVLKPFHRFTATEFVKDYELQVIGAVKTIQAALPRLKNGNQSSIVLFSTVAVQTGFTYHSLVSSSKGAIEGLTRALAAELAPAIRVNCIAPSITDTPLASSLLNTDDKKSANAQRHPLKRIGTPDDAASLAEFLLSDASSWMTGQILRLDGGISSIKSSS
jgi:NAD(P)-dependent dehydrogenase (short-subunit alcohol dehydrogenase family)